MTISTNSPVNLPGSPADTPVPTNTAVSARNVSKHYGRGETAVHALRDVSLDFEKGRFTAIMGPSGSGKSTLMHCLAGLDSVDAGRLWIGGTDITGLADADLTRLRREHVGFVFQAFNLVPTLTAEQNITLPVALAGGKVDSAWLQQIASTLGLTDRLSHRPHELSGGQQQRVAVARALLTRPDVIFGDEPTGNLDSTTGAEVLSLLRRSCREMGQSIIMVTHDPVAASYADRVVLMKDGALVGELQQSTPEAILGALATLGA
ncbi:ABC transporter ATP-binding protein [Arthrobacter agilis]|uniref:ABC transporter ATP-binding protein n=1 Tax=Arthrobacter agilis TaxID=37921 RepID=UPI000B34B920|nr:ABC transporter ATP-binding protein [Arthrobacter agilis]OUM42179.1 ABC transporter [Arthrobacter agilis]PPB45524.1 ABC transporter ATP-binding protein [Arthrobacter agilis]TPV26498.1 ABC transporter ATP-binding protein [Arthrobacter agilis]WDF33193.1 ABC transporter ATP-binding protein [Arthrobacter agilis]VDR33590.1 Macrolide export ATP-binding/permease protein MacB [Arthrobacter agilis]